MARKSFLICFTGVDGSGKTSHAKSLVKYLNQRGYSSCYVWGAPRLIFSYIFFAFTRIMSYWKETKKNAYTNPLEYASEKLAEKLGLLLRFFYFVDFHIKALFSIRLPLMLGKNVICDRYFYDLLMELERTDLSSKKFTYLLSRTLPHPAVTFLLDAPEVLISKRREFSYTEIRSKKEIFLKLNKAFNFIVIDSSKDFSDNQKRIRETALAYIRAQNVGNPR